MDSEEKFKKDLSDLLATKEFPFEEVEWQKTSAMLDARKNRKRAILYIAALLLLLGIPSVIYFYPSQDHSTQVSHIGQPVNEVVPAPKLPAEEKSLDIKKSAPEKISKPDAVESTAPRTAATDQPPIAKPQHLDQPQASQPQHSDQKSQSVSDTKAPETKQVTAKDKNPEKAAPIPSAQINAGINSSATSKDAVEVPSTNKTGRNEEPISSAKQNDETAAPQVNKTTQVNETTNDKAQNANADQPAKPAAEKPLIPEDPAPVTADSKTVAEKMNAVSEQIATVDPKTETEKTLPASTLQTSPAKVDSAAAVAALKPDTDYVKKKRPEINFEAGGNYLFGWKDGASRDASGINPVIGINYLLGIMDGVKLNIGLQYTSVGHLKSSNYISKITRLDLGEISQVTSFTPQKIHYLLLPLKVNFGLNESSAIGGGFTFGYLLTVDSKVEKYNQTIAGPSDPETHYEKGYTEGFNDLDMQVSVFYQRTIYKRLKGNIEFVYGLSDVKTGVALPSTGQERNMGLKLTLLYNIFNKK